MRWLILTAPVVVVAGADVPKMDVRITSRDRVNLRQPRQRAGAAAARAAASPNPKSAMKSFGGGTHGVGLFVKDRELRPAIVQWLQGVMK